MPGLYARPTRCKYCDRVFDFPTLTTDITERDIPVRTRTCGDCIWEMGQNEELRASRARADEESRRATIALFDKVVPTMNGHQSAQTTLPHGDRNDGDAKSATCSTASTEQIHPRPGDRNESSQIEDHPVSEPRIPQPRPLSGLHQLLN